MTPFELRIIQCREEVERIVLTEEEVKEAIYQGKLKKHFHLKNKPYWDEKEKKD